VRHWRQHGLEVKGGECVHHRRLGETVVVARPAVARDTGSR